MRQVLITGASSDIGIGLCRRYLEKGYRVVAHYRSGQPAFFELADMSPDMVLLPVDFSDPENVEAVIRGHGDTITGSDVLVNAAAVLESVPFAEISPDTLLRALIVNLIPAVLLVRSIAPVMAERGWGRIVNISSIGVKFGGGSASFCYALSKHALEFLPAEHTAWAARDVFINTVRLGVTDTRIHHHDPSKDLAARIAKIPAGRMATIAEVADIVYWLGSEENPYITGQVVAAAGGE